MPFLGTEKNFFTFSVKLDYLSFINYLHIIHKLNKTPNVSQNVTKSHYFIQDYTKPDITYQTIPTFSLFAKFHYLVVLL